MSARTKRGGPKVAAKAGAKRPVAAKPAVAKAAKAVLAKSAAAEPVTAKPRKLPEGLTLRPIFRGVSKEGLQLLAAIAEQQEREFYHANKDDFRRLCVEPMEALVGELRDRLAPEFPGQTLPPGKVFRLFRDVRFGNDKRPYKDHLSGMVTVAPGPVVTEAPAAIYVQLGPDSFAGAGVYGLAGPQLAAYREAVLDDKKGPELVKLLQPLLDAGATIDAREALKKVPAGVDPAHPRAALLKNKGLIVGWGAIPVKVRTSPELVEWLAQRAVSAAPLVRWIVRNVSCAG